MKLKALAALPMIAALSVAPAMAGTYGTAVSDPDVVVAVAPPPPPPPVGFGGLGTAGAVAAGVATALVLAAVLGSSDDSTE